MKECTLDCGTLGCGLNLTATFDDDDDPTEAGLLAGASAAHLAAHPDHELTIYEEPADDGGMWRLAERATRDYRHEIDAAELLRRSEERDRRRREEFEARRLAERAAELANQPLLEDA